MVEREDDLNGAASFFAVDGGAFAGPDGFEGVFEIALVPFESDGGGIGGAGGGAFAGRRHHRGAHFFIGGRLLFEFPFTELVVFEEDRSFGAAELDFGGVAVGMVAGGGTLDGADSAVLELKDGDCDVFHLDAFVGDAVRECTNRLNIARDVDEEIDCMDGLVHDGAPAVELPGATPGAGVVVCLIAEPFDISVREREFSEASGVGRFFEGDGGGVEAAGEDAGEDDFVFPAGGDHGIDAFEGHLERFFANHVFFCVGGGDGRFEVSA